MSIDTRERVRPAVVVQQRPDVQSRPVTRHASREWLPLLGWWVDDGVRHSRVNVIPRGNTRDQYERFVAVLKFYRGGEHPVHTFVSEPFSGDTNFRYESHQLLDALGESTFEGLVEIVASSLDSQPSAFPWVDSWLEFFTNDGTFSGSVPGFVFKGGTTKRVVSGKWQHWPGVISNPDFSTSILLLNYRTRATEVRCDLFAPDGRMAQSEVFEVPARMPGTYPLEDLVPGTRDLLKETGFGSLRIWSAYKLPAFVLLANRHTGQVSSFDHTVPFAGEPLD